MTNGKRKRMHFVFLFYSQKLFGQNLCEENSLRRQANKIRKGEFSQDGEHEFVEVFLKSYFLSRCFYVGNIRLLYSSMLILK